MPSLGDQPHPWGQWWLGQREGRELYRLERSGYAQIVTGPPSFNCELRDRLMSIQLPPEGNATWCPQRHPGEFSWTNPIMVNGIRLEPRPAGTTFIFNQEQHVLSTGSGRATTSQAETREASRPGGSRRWFASRSASVLAAELHRHAGIEAM